MYKQKRYKRKDSDRVIITTDLSNNTKIKTP